MDRVPFPTRPGTSWTATLLGFALGLLLGLTAGRAEPPPAAAETATLQAAGWEQLAFLVPMRDGVRLYTEVFRPLHPTGPLPFLLKRTPYGAALRADRFVGSLTNALKELAADGYLLVNQDLRGRFQSEGSFVMLRPLLAPGAAGVDEATDTYDTLAWLLEHVPGNNGRAGIYGTSYLGWTTIMATLRPHPALRAACEEASPADMFLGDDFHHNGAFRLSYGYEYAYEMESTRTNVTAHLDHYDAFEAYLGLGPLSAVQPRWLKQLRLPSWDDFVAHPNYDAFWQRQALAGYLTNAAVPMLHVAGWWDQEDFYGPQAAYAALEKHDRAGRNFFVAGPWNHGGWNAGEGRRLGAVDFGSATGQYYREQIRARWFAMHLHDRNPTNFPEAMTFQTGANRWESHASWPPKAGVTRRSLYFQPAGGLAFARPTDPSARAADSFVSDPAHPVPYRKRPIEVTYADGSHWGPWLVEDQRHAHGRPDVLSYATEELTEDLVVTGEVFADLFAATTGTDADWVVKLIDVYPQDYPGNPALGGYQLMVANEVFRGRFRGGFEHPAPIPANRVLPWHFSLHGMNHCFRRGHRIMVQVQSTWFPLIDRNPQRYVPNIFQARAEDFQSATHRIFRNRDHASHLDLPVREAAPN